MTEQFLAPALRPEEDELERSLRPRDLDDFVGQDRVKEQLDIALKAARARAEPLDHVLLVGPPGLGKTSLAYIVREELGVGIRCVAGPALERKGDMASILTALEPRDVLFIDEIHRLSSAVEEVLYPALEDFRLDIVVGQGHAARTLTLEVPPFTLVGATTRTGLLTTPLRDRFGMTFRLEYYEPDELGVIVRRSAGILGVEIAGEAADEIASRSRGTPRVANRILRRVRDVAEVRHEGVVTTEVAAEALELLEVDGHGLERTDRALLKAIVERFDGGPVGLSTLAVALGEEPDTVEDVYEPYLLQLGFIQRTPRGRIVTKLGPRARGRCEAGGSALLDRFGLRIVEQRQCAVDRGDDVAATPLRRVVPGVDRERAGRAAEDVRGVCQRLRLDGVRDEVGVEPVVVAVPAREQRADERPGRRLVAPCVDDVPSNVPGLSAPRPTSEEEAASLRQHRRSRIVGCL